MAYKLVHYINQFFAGIGGEDKADVSPEVRDGIVGPGMAFKAAFNGEAEIVATFICGDNYCANHLDDVAAHMVETVKAYGADGLIAGPAFNAGRYGTACGAVCAAVAKELQLPVVSGMYRESPGVDLYRKEVTIVETADSARGMGKAVPAMAAVMLKLLKGEEIADPEAAGVFPKGIRKNMFYEQPGAERAVQMLIKKLNGEAFRTEYPMPVFDRVEPRPAIADISKATIIDPVTSPKFEDYAATYAELRKAKGVTIERARDVMSDATYYATMMVKKDDADGMVSGAVNTTAHTIRPAFEFIKTKPGYSVVSSVFLMCLKDRVLVFGDCAVNPNPTSQQLAEIAVASADTAKVFGIDPRVAMLSYSTGTSGKGADVDVVVEATALAKEKAPELSLEGPLQYDAAIDPTVAKTKLPNSKVAGKATVFIFPDLNTGNNTYKAVQRAAEAVAIGPVLQGLNKPVNDLSRGCTVPDIVNTVAITAIQAAAEKQK